MVKRVARFEYSGVPLGSLWWCEGRDHLTGDVVWLLTSDPHAEGVRTLDAWASHVAAGPPRRPNPYAPQWKPESELKPKDVPRQRKLQRLWRKEREDRGRHTEKEEEIKDLVRRGALFVVSHSGGKDSQAQLVQVRKVVPDEQLLVVHAPLRMVEWEGAVEQARADTPPGVPFLLAEPVDKHGHEKTLLGWILERARRQVSRGKYGAWPSKAQRWCTSDFKTGPIRKVIKRYADEHGHTLIVEAWGLRAEESERRAESPALYKDKKESGVKSRALRRPREWWVWLPIKWMTTEEVFDTIHAAGKQPLWTYQEGMSRASCAFCILASQQDLRLAAHLAPELYALYVAVERIVDEMFQEAQGVAHTMKKGKTIEQTTGIPADARLVAQYMNVIRETGDVTDVPIAAAVPRPTERRLRRLRVLTERDTQRPKTAQMELLFG